MNFQYNDEQKCAFSVFELPYWSQGYKDVPHGGIIAAIFDDAMSNYLFAKGLTAVTAELNIRFKQPLKLLWGNCSTKKKRKI